MFPVLPNCGNRQRLVIMLFWVQFLTQRSVRVLVLCPNIVAPTKMDNGYFPYPFLLPSPRHVSKTFPLHFPVYHCTITITWLFQSRFSLKGLLIWTPLFIVTITKWLKCISSCSQVLIDYYDIYVRVCLCFIFYLNCVYLSNSPIYNPNSTHYNDVTMGAIASQITSLTIVYSIVYSDADQRKHQSSASLAFVRGIHRGPVNSPHKWPVTRIMFPFDNVIMSTHSFHPNDVMCSVINSVLLDFSNCSE